MRALSDMVALRVFLLPLIFTLGAAGCASTSGPSDTLRAYASAL
jgi:hypothetical protein